MAISILFFIAAWNGFRSSLDEFEIPSKKGGDYSPFSESLYMM